MKIDVDQRQLADEIEELLETLNGAFLADPQQPGATLLDLVDQGQILVPFGILDLIDADGPDRCASPHSTTYSTAWQTLSQVLRKATAVSCQDSLRAQ